VPVAFHTIGEVRPLMNMFAVPLYDDPEAPPVEIKSSKRNWKA
jgi:hypothetical protein